MPMLGILASQILGHLSSFESIATVTVGAGGASSISFASIPQTYTHLQVRGITRSLGTTTSPNEENELRLNGDTGANYSLHRLAGGGASATSDGFSGLTFTESGFGAGATANANVFSAVVLDILDYADTNKYKTIRSLNGFDNNGGGQVALFSGAWLSTAAVTSLLIYTYSGAGFAQYSSLALYGIKG